MWYCYTILSAKYIYTGKIILTIARFSLLYIPNYHIVKFYNSQENKNNTNTLLYLIISHVAYDMC